MADKRLATYLNDHLAGAIAGGEMLEYLIASYAGEAAEGELRQVHGEVVEDRRELEQLMEALGVKESGPRKVAGWVGEKFAQWKLRMDDLSHEGALRRYEASEAISLGIEGKRSMWVALREVARERGEMRVADYDGLIQRAEGQRAVVDGIRLGTARETFGVAVRAGTA